MENIVQHPGNTAALRKAANNRKRVNLALQGAKELGVSLPNTASAAQLMQACAANGMAGLDHSALCRSLELMANHQIAPTPAA